MPRIFQEQTYFRYSYRLRGTTHQDYFQDKLEPGFDLVDAAGCQGMTFLAVKRSNDSSPVPKIYLLLAQVRGRGLNFSYRLIDETDYFADRLSLAHAKCPAKILKQLTLPEILYQDQLAKGTLPVETFQRIIKWRSACWEKISYQKYINKVSSGDCIKFEHPQNYYSYNLKKTITDQSIFFYSGYRKFHNLEGENAYLLNWRKQKFTILNQEESAEYRAQLNRKLMEKRAKENQNSDPTIFTTA